jgi:hypothetical protein
LVRRKGNYREKFGKENRKAFRKPKRVYPIIFERANFFNEIKLELRRVRAIKKTIEI